MEIRTARDEDWPQIYPFYARTVDEGRTYTLPEGLGMEEARPLWMEGPPWRTVVAVDGDRIAGTAKMGPNLPGRGAGVAGASFMVNPDHRGSGVGRALGEHVIAWCREAGFRGIRFNAVVETNEAAVRLWKSLGFEIVGTVPDAFDHVDHGPVGLHVMYRRL